MKPTRQVAFDRKWARRRIVHAANTHGLAPAKPFTMKNLNEAVAKVRRGGFVKNEVLIKAGFNPVKVTPKEAAR